MWSRDIGSGGLIALLAAIVTIIVVLIVLAFSGGGQGAAAVAAIGVIVSATLRFLGQRAGGPGGDRTSS